MPFTTINTNLGAFVALSNLRNVQFQLDATQKKISTGYNVNDALDNGAVFGIAQSTRAQISGTIAANQELGNFIGAIQTASAGATGVSNTLSQIRAVLTSMADSFLTTTQFNQYALQYQTLVSSISTYVSGSAYNGVNLLSTGNPLTVVQDGNASLLTITGTVFNINSALGGLSAAAPATYTAAASILSLGTFNTVLGSVATVLNQVGALNMRATLQQNFNNSVNDALATGLGSLIDADLAKESANLTSLQVKQQLSTQSLSIANQAPNSLLTLFRNN